MIIGIGSDLADMRRLQATLDRFGDRFLARVFTPHEQARAARKADRIGTLARRFAAKEACAKALGAGVPRRGVHWADLGVVNLPSGQPTMALTGGAAERLAAITPPGHTPHIWVSLTDDPPYALAFVVIEALPPPG